MSATTSQAVDTDLVTARRIRRTRTIDLVGLIATIATVIAAILWAFPLYWGVITSLKPESEVVQAGIKLWPEHITFEAYTFALFGTKLGSLTSGAVYKFLVEHQSYMDARGGQCARAA